MKSDGYIVIHSPTMQLWFATRGLDADPKAAEETVRKHKLYAWSERDNPPPTKFIPVAGRSWSSNQPDNLNIGNIFLTYISRSRSTNATA